MHVTDIPTDEPLAVRAGDNWAWDREFDHFPPSDGWTLKYALVKSGVAVISFDATTSGTKYQVRRTATQTEAYAAGVYAWQSWVEKGAGAATERYTLDTGTIEVLPRFSALSGAGTDLRTHAKKMLDAIEASLEGRATKAQKSYSIAGRTLEYLTPKELTEWRNYYRSEYQKELNAERISAGEAPKNRLLTRLR